VVLFLQSYRLKLGGESIFYGFSSASCSRESCNLDFPCAPETALSRMLILTGALLGVSCW